MNLNEKLITLPRLPGVYRFLNKDHEILYIGKSKNLRNRVRSYFTGTKEGKIARLVGQISDLEIETCDTHLEARLLECRRIKEIRPPYNSQFKRERGFSYVRIGTNRSQSPLAVENDPTRGFGPFRNRRLLESIIDDFPKLYPIVTQCTVMGETLELPSEAFSNAVPVRSCHFSFRYFILPRRLEPEEYHRNQFTLELLFQGEKYWKPFLWELERAMRQSAQAELFQEAIFFRDFIGRLKLLHRFWFEDQELFRELVFLKIPTEHGLKYFRIRNGFIEDETMGMDETASDFERFCRDSTCRLEPAWSKLSEKTRFDFKDILYSEIRALPEEQVMIGLKNSL